MMDQRRRVRAALRGHAGAGERRVVVETKAGPDWLCRIRSGTESLPEGLGIIFPREALPRMAHWQHYGPRGSYASALEPFRGSLLGSARDSPPLPASTLAPDESRRYQLGLRI